MDAARAAFASGSGGYAELARRLDAKVMEPIRPLLGGSHDVVLSPDGALILLPFGALIDEQNRYLVTQSVAIDQDALPRFDRTRSLTDAERVVVQETLRQLAASAATQQDSIAVAVTPDGVKLTVAAADMERVRSRIAEQFPWLSPTYSYFITARTALAFEPLQVWDVKAALIDNGRIAHEQVLRTLVLAFRAACGAEVDPASRKADTARLRWEFSSIERAVATTEAFKGFQVKERLTVVVEDGAHVSGSSPGSSVDIILDGHVCWRRLSSRDWQCGSSRDALRRDALASTGSGGFAECTRQLLQSIERDP